MKLVGCRHRWFTFVAVRIARTTEISLYTNSSSYTKSQSRTRKQSW